MKNKTSNLIKKLNRKATAAYIAGNIALAKHYWTKAEQLEAQDDR